MTLPAHKLTPYLPTSEDSREHASAIASGCDELTRARVRAAGAGDRRAQRWLAEAVLTDVRKVARSLVRTREDADDASQFAMLQVLKAAEGFRGQASVRHWARRVATRAVLKHQRRARLRSDRERPLTELREFQSEHRVGQREGQALRHALPRSLQEYLDELPAEQSEVLVLKHALGYSVPEIATLTDVSPNTVKGRLRLATKEMRRRVSQETLTGRPERNL